MDDWMDNKLWSLKVCAAELISKLYGFPEQNQEFWARQPAGVISLLIKVYLGGDKL